MFVEMLHRQKFLKQCMWIIILCGINKKVIILYWNKSNHILLCIQNSLTCTFLVVMWCSNAFVQWNVIFLFYSTRLRKFPIVLLTKTPNKKIGQLCTLLNYYPWNMFSSSLLCRFTFYFNSYSADVTLAMLNIWKINNLHCLNLIKKFAFFVISFLFYERLCLKKYTSAGWD